MTEGRAGSSGRAREDALAAETLKQMLSKDNSGKTHLKLAQVYLATEDWQQVIDTLSPVVGSLQGNNKGRAQLLLGTSYFYPVTVDSQWPVEQIQSPDPDSG